MLSNALWFNVFVRSKAIPTFTQ